MKLVTLQGELDMATTETKGVSLDELQEEAEWLLSLLKDRQLGLFSWHIFLRKRLQKLHDLSSQALEKMVTLENIGGGVEIFGHNALNWKQPEGRRLYGSPVVFDSKTSEPWYDERTRRIMLPARPGQQRYTVHLLETGEALVITGGEYFLYALTPSGLAVLKVVAQS